MAPEPQASATAPRPRKAVKGSQTVCLLDLVTVLLSISFLSPRISTSLCFSYIFSLCFCWIDSFRYPFFSSQVFRVSSFATTVLRHLDPAAQHSPDLIFCHFLFAYRLVRAAKRVSPSQTLHILVICLGSFIIPFPLLELFFYLIYLSKLNTPGKLEPKWSFP